jgi:hypothetical protein
VLVCHSIFIYICILLPINPYITIYIWIVSIFVMNPYVNPKFNCICNDLLVGLYANYLYCICICYESFYIYINKVQYFINC